MNEIGYHGTCSKHKDSIESNGFVLRNATIVLIIGWDREYIFLTIMRKHYGGLQQLLFIITILEE